MRQLEARIRALDDAPLQEFLVRYLNVSAWALDGILACASSSTRKRVLSLLPPSERRAVASHPAKGRLPNEVGAFANSIDRSLHDIQVERLLQLSAHAPALKSRSVRARRIAPQVDRHVGYIVRMSAPAGHTWGVPLKAKTTAAARAEAERLVPVEATLRANASGRPVRYSYVVERWTMTSTCRVQSPAPNVGVARPS